MCCSLSSITFGRIILKLNVCRKVKCCVCSESADGPVKLPCRHMTCLKCIVQLKELNLYFCPECEKAFPPDLKVDVVADKKWVAFLHVPCMRVYCMYHACMCIACWSRVHKWVSRVYILHNAVLVILQMSYQKFDFTSTELDSSLELCLSSSHQVVSSKLL